jgi:hypothetical protein
VSGGDEEEIAISPNEESSPAATLDKHLHGIGKVVLGQVGLANGHRRH